MIDPEQLIETMIGDGYRLTRYLGKGSFGWVFEAHEELLGQHISRVAVKLTRPEDEAQREAVLREICGLAQLAHDHVIAYRACGQVAEGRLSRSIFLVTELGETSLDQAMRSPFRLSAEELQAMARGIAAALAHLHGRGAMHRDVKPANIFRVEGRWKLADFGLVRSVREAPASGADRKGTPAYMAPEALDGKIGPAMDIYALGVTLLEALTGHLAHQGTTEEEFIRNVRTRPASIPADLPEPWRTVIPRCLERDPHLRCTAEQLCQWLQTPISLPVGELSRFEGHTDAIKSVAFSPDGRRALSSSQDRTLRLWEIESGRDIRRFRGHTDGVNSIAFSPDGRRALSGSDNRTVCLWEIDTGCELRRFEGHTGWVSSVAFSPNGRYALSGSLDDTVRLWEIDTGRELRRFKGSQVSSVAFSHDGRRVLVGSDDGTLRLWEVKSGREARRFNGCKSLVNSAVLSPDGRRALSGSTDHLLHLWDVESGREIRCFQGHESHVNSVAFSPDGRRALSGSMDHTLRLWEVESGREIHCFRGHEDWVNSVAFSPDGRRALSGSRDKTLRLWGLPG